MVLPHQKELDKALQLLKDDGDNYNLKMSVDGTVTEYLGIGIEEVRKDKGKLRYQITQEGLITNILSTTGITDYNGKATTTSGEAPLQTNLYDDPYSYHTKWLYASIIGMMTYLAYIFLLEIQFSVHQCDLFTHNYQASHGDAIIHTCCYLKETHKKGLILKHVFQGHQFALAHFNTSISPLS